MTRPLVLIVEDEPDIANLISFHIERDGCRTEVVRSGVEALKSVSKQLPALMTLDVMLPDLSGLEVCRRLKADSATRDLPIIMVSARGEESDIVVGLELGADDYVAKPFSPRVLLARVNAVIRRSRQRDAGDATGVVKRGSIEIDTHKHEIRAQGKPLNLTLTEHRILEHLASRPGFVRTRDQIVAAVRGQNAVLSSRAIDVHIAGLRRKLAACGDIIETVRGVGYRLAEPVNEEAI